MSAAQLPAAERDSLRALLDPRRPGDAMASYYALWHPAAKVRLWVHRSPGGRLDGFLASARTGQDLFRPLIVLRAQDPSSAAELLAAAFPSPQAAIFTLPEPLGLFVLPLLATDSTVLLSLHRLNPAKLEPLINILVEPASSPAGFPRYEIRRGEKVAASAGVNWQSSDWAEIFVQTEPEARGRGYGKSVCAALCRHLLEQKKQILYAVEDKNAASLRLALGLGFEDTGEREILCYGSAATRPPAEGAANG